MARVPLRKGRRRAQRLRFSMPYSKDDDGTTVGGGSGWDGRLGGSCGVRLLGRKVGDGPVGVLCKASGDASLPCVRYELGSSMVPLLPPMASLAAASGPSAISATGRWPHFHSYDAVRLCSGRCRGAADAGARPSGAGAVGAMAGEGAGVAGEARAAGEAATA